MSYATGKHAFGICDRTGFRYPLKDLVWEFQNGKRTGLRVGKDVVDPDHPQYYLGRLKINDPQSLKDARPDVDPGRGLYGWNPVWNPAQSMLGSVGNVRISTE